MTGYLMPEMEPNEAIAAMGKDWSQADHRVDESAPDGIHMPMRHANG
jgi:hypothetical protein